MELIDKKRTALKDLIAETQEAHFASFGQSKESYLMTLRRRSQRLAEIVHWGQKDLAGKPYCQHVKRVAAKATNIVSFCGMMLHDVVEDGKELGITPEFLRETMFFPDVIVHMVIALSRNEDEPYSYYARRVLANYHAVKGKIDDNIDNADVSRFDDPGQCDIMRCQRYVQKAAFLKSDKDFQAQKRFDIAYDFMAINHVTQLFFTYDHTIDSEMIINRIYYFGHSDSKNRSYTALFHGRKDEQTGKITASITTYPSRIKLADYHVWTPRVQRMEFQNDAAAREYLVAFDGHLTRGGLNFSSELYDDLAKTPINIEVEEQKFHAALAQIEM